MKLSWLTDMVERLSLATAQKRVPKNRFGAEPNWTELPQPTPTQHTHRRSGTPISTTNSNMISSRRLMAFLLCLFVSAVLSSTPHFSVVAADRAGVEDDRHFMVSDMGAGLGGRPPIPIAREREVVDDSGDYDFRYWEVACTEADMDAITGLHKTLYKMYREKPIRNKFSGSGAFQRVRTDVDWITRLDYKKKPNAAWDNSWSAQLDLTFEFFLKQKSGFGIELDGGHVSVIDGVKTSALRRRFDAWINWDHKYKLLYVSVNDFDDTRDTGVQFESAPYYVTGRSVTSTISKKDSISSSYSAVLATTDKDGNKTNGSQTVAVGATHYTDSSKRRMKVTVNGATYHAEFGRFTATEMPRSDGGRLEFSFAARWITDCDISYREVADYTDVKCGSSKAFDLSASFIDRLTGASLNASSESICIGSKSQIPVDVSWVAQPTLDENTFREEGLVSMAKFITESDRHSGDAWYQTRFGARMIWRFRAYPAEGSGGGIDVINGGTGDHESHRYYIQSY